MGMFQDWVEKKVDEVRRISDRELAGTDLRVNPPSIGVGDSPDPYGMQITRGGGMPNPALDRWYQGGEGSPDPDMDSEAPESPEAPAPEPFSQARRKALQAAQNRKPSSQEGQEMARGIRMMNPQLRGQINMVNDKLKGADLATLRRVNAAIDRIIGQESSFGEEV